MSLHFISLLNSLLIFGQPPTRPACHSLPGLLLILCGCAVSQVFLCQSVVLSFEDSVIPDEVGSQILYALGCRRGLYIR